jgi:phage recombination protein Bet
VNSEIVRMADVSPTTPFEIQTDEQPIEMSVQDVLQWVPGAAAAPQSEALRFLMTCRIAKVNPFIGEAYLVNYGHGYQTVVSKSGWLKQAMRHPDYAGHEAGVIIRPKGGGAPEFPEGTFFEDSTHLLRGGWARINFKSDRRPVFMSVRIDEYNKGQSTWKSAPGTMIRKVALVRALDEAFGLGGAYDSVEMPSPAEQVAAEPETVIDTEVVQAEYAKTDVPSLPPALLDRLAAVAKTAFDFGVIDYDVWAEALRSRGVTTAAELSEVQAHDILRKLEAELAPSPFAAPEPPPKEESPPADDDGKGFDRQAVIEEVWTMAGMCGLHDNEIAAMLEKIDDRMIAANESLVAIVDGLTDRQLSVLHDRLDAMERQQNHIEIPPLTRPEPTEDAPKKRGRKPKAEVATAPTA